MIAAIFNRDDTLRSMVAQNNAFRATLGLPPSSANTASLCDARTRLDVGVVREAATGIALEINAKVARSDFWGDLHPYVIDGTTLTANDTPENQHAFPQHGAQATGVGFPLLRAVVIQSLTTGMIVNCAMAASRGKGTGEMALARETLPSLQGNVLLLGDRYYPSFFFIAELMSKGWNGIFQAHASRDVDFRCGEWLANRDHLVEWQRPPRPEWMTSEEYAGYPTTISMREMEVREKKLNQERVVVVTTLVDQSLFPKHRVAAMYRKRWKVELALRDLKVTFGLCHVAACTPAMVEKVIWAHMLAYNVLRWHMLNASILYETELDEISVTAAASVLSANATLIASCTDYTRPKIFAAIYEQIIKVPVGRRPGRSEPRVNKKRPKPQRYLMEPRSDWRAKQST
jgi:hypothetical protein